MEESVDRPKVKFRSYNYRFLVRGLLDSREKRWVSHHLVQCLLAGITIAVILTFLNLITKAVVVAVLGDSSTVWGLLVYGFTVNTVAFILLSITLLALAKYILRRYLSGPIE